MNYVDIATPLMDETGYLAAGLSSDGSLHLTNKAYEIWANTIRVYISNFLALRAAASTPPAVPINTALPKSPSLLSLP
jgi:hypothetical protein